MKAVWNGVPNADFQASSVREDLLRPSSERTSRGWKGNSSSSLDVDGQVNEDAAWFYPDPSSAAEQSSGPVAFRRGVEVAS